MKVLEPRLVCRRRINLLPSTPNTQRMCIKPISTDKSNDTFLISRSPDGWATTIKLDLTEIIQWQIKASGETSLSGIIKFTCSV